jgi:hypothetical protein
MAPEPNSRATGAPPSLSLSAALNPELVDDLVAANRVSAGDGHPRRAGFSPVLSGRTCGGEPAVYLGLVLVLGPAGWEGDPGAVTRVGLPLTFAFNSPGLTLFNF